MSTQNALFTILVEKINNDTLVLPTLPAIALKVRRAADNPNINLNAMAEVVSQDPSLSARMIKISNSAHLGRAVKVTSTQQAVTRIGLAKIKNISTALAMEQLFVSKNSLVTDYLQKIWSHTIDVVAYSMAALQLHLEQTKKRGLNQDTMMLTALMHNIGVLPVLTEAERHPDVFSNQTFLQVAMDQLAGRLGASIMRKWDFDADLVLVAEHWQDLSVQQAETSYMDFVRIGEVLAGSLVEHKEAILAKAIDKGIVTSLDDFQSDEFAESVRAYLQVFE